MENQAPQTSVEKPGLNINQSGMDRKIQKKLITPQRIAYAVGGFVLGIFVLYLILTSDGGSRLNVDPEKITISKVAAAPFQEYIPVQGSILPIETFFLDATEGGRVEVIYKEAGSNVRKGDPILRLANTNLQLDVMYREALSYEQINNAQNRRLALEQNTISVKAAVTEVEYQVERLRTTHERDSALAAKNLISPQEFKLTSDEYTYWLKRRALAHENFKQDSILRSTQIGQLDESVKRLQENLNMVKQNLDNLTLRAPISGQLTSLNAEIGQSRTAGQRLGQIDVLDNFKVRVAIDEFYISRINTGQTGEFDLANTSYKLLIKKVYPEVRDGRFEVDMEFAGSTPPGIRRGQTLQIRLELGDLSEAVLLPRGGFYQKTGGQWVYVVDPSGDFATKRTIKLGRQNPQMFEVLEGLQPGEQAVTSSYDNFGEIDRLVLKK
jgi:HlyD family secretion protein